MAERGFCYMGTLQTQVFVSTMILSFVVNVLLLAICFRSATWLLIVCSLNGKSGPSF